MKTIIKQSTKTFFSILRKEEIVAKTNPMKLNELTNRLTQNLSLTDLDSCMGKPIYYWIQNQFPLVKKTKRFGME